MRDYERKRLPVLERVELAMAALGKANEINIIKLDKNGDTEIVSYSNEFPFEEIKAINKKDVMSISIQRNDFTMVGSVNIDIRPRT